MSNRRGPLTQILITAKDEASGVFNALQRNAGKVAALIAGYFGVKFFTTSIQSAAEFEQQMSTVAAVTRATTEELDLLRKAADDAGTNTRFTATEAAQALENLARAGLNATEAVQALPAVLGLAQANNVGLAESSALVTRAVRGMGLEVAEAGRVADVLTEASARANTNVEGLGAALSFAAPTAQSLGLSLEDTVAIIGKFADAGIDASRAGTALNSILAQFSNPASTFRRELSDAGITTTNFNEALRQLAASGPLGARAIIAVGQEAGPALRALLNQGIESLDGLRGALLNAGGAAANAAAVMDGNLDGAIRGLSSAWDGFRRSLVNPVIEPITLAVVDLSERLRTFVSSGVVTRVGEVLATAFKAGADAFFDFLNRLDIELVIGRLKAWAQSTRETIQTWSDSLKTASDVAAVAFGSIATGINTIQSAFFALSGVVAQVVSVIAASWANVFEILARVSDRFRVVAEEVRFFADSMGASADTNFRKASEALDNATASSERLRANFTDLIGVTDGASASISRTADETSRAASGVQELSDSLTSVAASAAGAGAAAAGAEAQLQTLGVTSAEQLRIAAEEARLAFETIRSSGTATAEEVQRAFQAYADASIAANNRLADSTLQTAAEIAAQVQDAFRELGVTSTAELQRSADRARAAFETIRSSGTASAADVQRAFQVYAQRAVAANNGVVDSTLRAAARIAGLRVEADSTGKVIVDSMNRAAQATSSVGSAAGRSAQQLQNMADAAERVANVRQGGGGSGGGGAPAPVAPPPEEEKRKPRQSTSAGDLIRLREAAGTLTTADLELARRAYETAFANAATFSRTAAADGLQREAQFQRRIFERLQAEQQREQQESARRTEPAAQAQLPPPPPPASGASQQLGVITININGRERQIPTTPDGAREIESVLRELERAAGTAQ